MGWCSRRHYRGGMTLLEALGSQIDADRLITDPDIMASYIHDDAEWVEALVRRLTSTYESPRIAPWSVDDAPKDFIAGQLRAIVGVELVISRVEAKFKMSQNRPEADIDGVILGLTEEGDQTAAHVVAQLRP